METRVLVERVDAVEGVVFIDVDEDDRLLPMEV